MLLSPGSSRTEFLRTTAGRGVRQKELGARNRFPGRVHYPASNAAGGNLSVDTPEGDQPADKNCSHAYVASHDESQELTSCLCGAQAISLQESST